MSDIPSTLLIAAALVGSLHTAAPDHWMPFAALARARGWSRLHTARTTILCGAGHVTVSALLGIGSLIAGVKTMEMFGGRLEHLSTYVLLLFGLVYLIWGVRRSFRRDALAVVHSHDHHHAFGQNDHDHGLTEWSLILLYSSDPCVALIPMIFAAAASGWTAVALVILAYEVATIATMVGTVTAAYSGAQVLPSRWFDRFGHPLAGTLIVLVAVIVFIHHG